MFSDFNPWTLVTAGLSLLCLHLKLRFILRILTFRKRMPGRNSLAAVLYLMCDELRTQATTLAKKGVQCSAIQEAPWGISTCIPLPSGRALGLYQPSHEMAINLNSKSWQSE